MKLGLKWSDNDFHHTLRVFFELFIIPTYKDVGDGHMVTHLTPSMVVEMFKLHMPYIDRYLTWEHHSERYPQYKKLHDYPLSNYFIITESDVFFDAEVDKAINDWDDFIYFTNGVDYK
jgi:hypothetical protein